MVVTLLCHSEEHRDEESVFPLPAFKKTDPSTPLRSAQDDTEIITKRKAPILRSRLVFALPIFPGSRPPSIVGVHELNFCVRDGERWERRLRRIRRPERLAAVGERRRRSRQGEHREPQQETGGPMHKNDLTT